MHNLISQLELTITLLQKNLLFVLTLVGSLYVIHILNWIAGYRLNFFGIWPRKLHGMPGIVLSPFLHADFNHLFFNSIPLFIMVSFVLLNGMKVFYCVSAIIILMGGGLTWALGRRGVHVGASGVIMGYWGYLLIEAYKQPTALSIALAIVCIYYFGGVALNLFPMKVKSSWEAHFFGFLAGLTAAYSLPSLMPYINSW